MNFADFKAEARRRGNYEDNTAKAQHEWAKSWGLTEWYLCWAWQSYTLGDMEYKGGRVMRRHGSYISECYCIDGRSVSRRKFMEALAAFTPPAETAEELAHIEEAARLAAEAEKEAARLAYVRRWCGRRRKIDNEPSLFLSM